jgi:hypothetical protein
VAGSGLRGFGGNCRCNSDSRCHWDGRCHWDARCDWHGRRGGDGLWNFDDAFLVGMTPAGLARSRLRCEHRCGAIEVIGGVSRAVESGRWWAVGYMPGARTR